MKISERVYWVVSASLVLAVAVFTSNADAVILVDDHFTASPGVDTNTWITRIPQNPPTDDLFSGVGGTNLNIINSGAGGFWGSVGAGGFVFDPPEIPKPAEA